MKTSGETDFLTNGNFVKSLWKRSFRFNYRYSDQKMNITLGLVAEMRYVLVVFEALFQLFYQFKNF